MKAMICLICDRTFDAEHPEQCEAHRHVDQRDQHVDVYWCEVVPKQTPFLQKDL